MKHITTLLIFSICVAGILSGCSTVSSSELKTMSASQLYHNGEYVLSKKNYSDAIKYFETLQANFPFSPNMEQAQLELLYAYYEKGDYASTAVAGSRFLRLYPRSRHADYAYYLRGIAYIKQNRTIFQRIFKVNRADRSLVGVKQAFMDFRMLLTLYPHSEYAVDARQRMIYLRDILAQHELDVGMYYLRRKAYVAAANRGSSIVRHYQHAPQVEKGLAIMILSYQALGEKKLEQQAKRVLHLNFPHSHAVADVENMLG